ncbi:Phenylacetate-coenzyme A ligase [Dissulfuribacter thermophilus]|uniref:Phenylacetate-coenzyme A ligase n=2 Tax=Dissulfuribacter thermophilus TaxID=1156395 RepID=A0A1B9F4X3_9BACT|nr:Phenylacetate-coenzyme A ligase [Dissulfuribacter thermophilus]
MEDQQLKGLKWTVRHAYEGSQFYRKRLDEAGIGPDSIKSMDDLRRLPFTTAEDLKAGYPFPLLSVPFDKVVRIHSSSGTTGKRKVLAYTQKDIDDWKEFFARAFKTAGIGPGDRVQIAVGYGLWTAGAGFQAACERAGAMAIPVGPGNLDMQFQFLVDLKPNCLCCTASMALLIAEEAERRGLTGKLGLKKVIMGAERASDAMRRQIKELLGLDHIFDITGMTELYGPGAGIDCEYHQGIHYWNDYYILEIINPETLEPVEPGEIGEMVVTTLKKEASPLIRYRTRDLTRLIPRDCPCGLPYPRHDRILGRSDDMFIVRGVNVYPGHIDEILSSIEGVSSEYIIEITRENGIDHMCLKVERKRAMNKDLDRHVSQEIYQRIKASLMVSPRVEIVDYGSLPRSEKKSKRVFDYRGS